MRYTITLLVSLLLIQAPEDRVAAVEPGTAASAVLDRVSVRLRQSGSTLVAETENFRIRSSRTDLPLTEIARECERHRRQLMDLWMNGSGSDKQSSWSPICEIVIHRQRRDYLAYLGTAAGNSVGCTTIGVRHGRITERRIDLRADAADWDIDALPHELTHVVLADRFGNRPLPLWADEGMAVLAESPAKRALRQVAARQCERRLRAVSAGELLYDDQLPRSARVDAFYCRSSQLVELLVHQQDGGTFVDFIDQAMTQGYEKALRQHYSINGVGGLQPLLERSVYSDP